MPATLPRQRSIDLLRGIAVVLVMLLHYSLTYRLPDSVLGDLFTPKGVARLVMNGNYGVTMFFVISGYLITTNSLRRWGSLDRIDRWAFYRRRARRILPPLLVAVAVILVLGAFGRPSFVNKQRGEVLDPGFWWLAIGSVLTFWHNVLMQVEGYFNYALNIYWSLSVEEVFYLAFPLAATLLPKRGFLIACAALVVAGPVYRALHVERELDYLYGYPACFDAIAIGCLLAFVAPRMQGRGPWPVVMTVVASGCLAAVHLNGIGGHEVLGFSGIALSTAVIILFNVRASGTEQMEARTLVSLPIRALRWMGRHSYELYLFHIIVLGVMRDLVGRDELPRGLKLPWMLLFFGLSAAVAFGVGRWSQRSMRTH
ncbi:MAG TPA: acyltransferase [Flavobacteriales bacterium]